MKNLLPTWLLKRENVNEHLPASIRALSDFHWHAFLQQGLPTRQQERFKYADFSAFLTQDFKAANGSATAMTQAIKSFITDYRLKNRAAILLISINGEFFPELSDLHLLPENTIACKLQVALQQHAELLPANWCDIPVQGYPFANLNISHLQAGLFFYVPDDAVITSPIHHLQLTTEEKIFTHPLHLLILGKYTQLHWLNEHIATTDAAYVNNLVTLIYLGSSAQLMHYKHQAEHKNALHIAYTFLHQQQNSSAQLINLATGSQFARDDMLVNLQETGASCKAVGFYRLQYDAQYIDHHLDFNHLAPYTNSEMLYKGILTQKSRAVFNGKLYVAKEAQKITAFQGNHNLLLRDDAEVYSKPELEIYADDVQCKHGATVGQLNEEALFYLRARGIPRSAAIKLLLQGFADDIMQCITQDEIRERWQQASL